MLRISTPPPNQTSFTSTLRFSCSAVAAVIASVLSSVSATAAEIDSWNALEAVFASGNSDETIFLSKDLSVFDQKENPDGTDTLTIDAHHWTIDANGHSITGYEHDPGGWTAISIWGSEAASLTLKNLGNFDNSLLNSLLNESDLPAPDIGWYDGGLHGGISANGSRSNNASLVVDHSIFQRNTTSSAGTTIQLYEADLSVTSSLFILNHSQVFGGAAIFADLSSSIDVINSTFYGNKCGDGSSTQDRGSAIYAQRDSSLSIKNSVFQNNKAGTGGGAIYFVNGNSLHISNTIFHGNTASNSSQTAYAGALYASVAEGGGILIDSSVFTDNSSDYYGGALVINKSSVPTEFSVVQDSLLTNNKTGTFGAGITYLKEADTNNFLIAKHANTLFRNNQLSGSPEDGSSGEDIWLNSASMNLSINAYADRIIEFSGSISASESEENQAVLLLNVNNGLKTIKDSQIVDSSADIDAGKGTIVFRDKLENVSLHIGGGTLVLADGANLSSSILSIDAMDVVISTIEPLPFDQTTPASALFALDKVQPSTLQKIFFKGLSGTGTATVYLDVDLAQAQADYFELADESSVSDFPSLRIAGWNVLTDANEQKVVVAVADKALTNTFELAESGSIAKGDIYTYDVERLDETSEHPGDYLFTRRGTSPSVLNGDIYAGDAAAAGLALASHLIDMELPRHRSENWWGNIIGTSTEMKPGNFHEVDYNYGIGLFGWRSPSMDMGYASGSLGIFGGIIYGDSSYEDVDIRQNGALIGFEAFIESGSFWSATNVKFGTAKSDLSLSQQSKDISTTWFGFSETLGFNASTGFLTWTPSLSFSWLSIGDDDYHSSESVRVQTAKLNIAEISPGIAVKAPIANNWEGGFSFRYNFVNASGDKGRAADLQLESIDFDDYAEYGVTIRREDTYWNAGLLVEKSSDGRQGWNFRADFSWHF